MYVSPSKKAYISTGLTFGGLRYLCYKARRFYVLVKKEIFYSEFHSMDSGFHSLNFGFHSLDSTPWILYSTPWIPDSIPWIPDSTPWILVSIPWIPNSTPWIPDSTPWNLDSKANKKVGFQITWGEIEPVAFKRFTCPCGTYQLSQSRSSRFECVIFSRV